MYKIPDEYNLAIFLNKKVSQISFTLNSISINFDMLGFISFEGDFKFNKIEYKVMPVCSDCGLIQLLEKKVVNICTGEDKYNLILHFEDNYELVIVNDENYESYRISYNGAEIIM